MRFEYSSTCDADNLIRQNFAASRPRSTPLTGNHRMAEAQKMTGSIGSELATYIFQPDGLA